ncbi:hypothetical protein HYFRA_00013090 [Hymenoscyphus fraxineus]|uniref:ATPase AAA-type core domain-containing protein n=1 Tax=Hymenoscyphus fraxineus TaxID=746836 RepID=A0A9N9L319_9HELO|nr:hypothetical protein HYFRA_00013090 [Hymenoscyphus fraxineus]
MQRSTWIKIMKLQAPRMVPKLLIDSDAMSNMAELATGQKLNFGPQEAKENTIVVGTGKMDSQKEDVSDTGSMSTKNAIAAPQASQNEYKDEQIPPFNGQSPEPAQTPLYCSIKGKSHGALLEWGMTSCPACNINLSQSDPTSQQSPGPFLPETTRSKTEYPKDSIKDSHIEYKVKYLDIVGESLGMDPWEGPFDLEAAEAKASGTSIEATTPILEVRSLLQTDISDDKTRNALKVGLDSSNRNIIGNKDFDVEHVGTAIKIYSRPFIHALQKLISYWPDTSLVANSVEIMEPYAILIHHLDALEAYKMTYSEATGREKYRDHPIHKRTDIESCNRETFEHINIIEGYLQPYQKDSIREERKLHQQTPAVATYAMLWLLLKPGMTVYAQLDGSTAAFVVSEVKCEPSVLRKRGAYHVKLWYLDFDGRHVGRREHNAIIYPFDGSRDITSLTVYPCEYYDNSDGGALRTKLENRGEVFFSMLSGAQMEYYGESLGDKIQWYEGRVMIDNTSYYDYFTAQGSARYYQQNSGPKQGERGHKEYVFNLLQRPVLGELQDSEDVQRCGCIDCKENPQRNRNSSFLWSKYDNIDPKISKTLNLEDPFTGKISRHRYLLCPKRIMGFNLKARTWDPLNVECCSNPKIKNRAIDNLVMPADRLMLIKALVKKYTDNHSLTGKGIIRPWTADFIQNKGEGQLFLLHGSPGTAECISESTGRPLLSLTVGNIGTNEAKMEHNLSKWFRLAENWGAVMLVDEADIFLEKRVIADIHRNSLVSIFLRAVEYYRGILFLTTNRVGHFDDAFISRIHVVIHYEKFNDVDRKKVWEQFFNKLESERKKEIAVSSSARKYVLNDPEMRRIPWNGREIRNAFQTAVALAEYRFAESEDKEEGDRAFLERIDFEKVCEMTGSFKNYLTSVSAGADESGRAKGEGARDDNYKEH